MKQVFLVGLAALLGACTQAAPPAAKALNGTVDGIYQVDGKAVKISFARSYQGEPFANHPTVDIALTEKEASTAKGEPMMWGNKYGGAAVITLKKEDDGYHVISSTFLHPALKDGGSGGTGIVSLKEQKDANGEFAAELVSKPDEDLFGQKLNVDLKFEVPLPK
jgi:hypothetical protein